MEYIPHNKAIFANLGPGMVVPLTCIVDYHGFRVLAVAKVPIGTSVFTSSGKLRRVREDRVHGTCDGGGTILNESRILNAKLQDVAEKLNLSSHLVKVRHTQDSVLHTSLGSIPAKLSVYLSVWSHNDAKADRASNCTRRCQR